MDKKEKVLSKRHKYESRFHTVSVRFDKETEWPKILELATSRGLEVKPYVKSSALKRKVVKAKLPEPNKKLLYEINKIGTNFNQLVRKINEGNTSKNEAMDEFKIFHKLLRNTINKYT